MMTILHDDLAPNSRTWPMVPRVRPTRPLTRGEAIVVVCLATGMNYKQVARLLQCSYQGVKNKCLTAAKKIPGNLPAQAKMVVWFRGADEDVLTGDRVAAN